MTITPPITYARLQLVDVLRGIALFGIVIIHSIEHFDLIYEPVMSEYMKMINTRVHDTVFFIFAGKAYSIFSILFGLSFFLQLQSQKAKGNDYTGRFIWRLCILFVIGYLLSLIYIGEILTMFAMMGLSLLLFQRLGNKTLLIIAGLFLLQIPTLYYILLSFTQPDFVFQQDWSAWAIVYKTFTEGSFWDVAKFNAFGGHMAKWQYMINAGRYLQIFGLLVIGLWFGRKMYFEKALEYKGVTKKIFLGSLFAFIFFYGSTFLLPSMNLKPVQAELIKILFASYDSFFFTLIIITGVVLLYLKNEELKIYHYLASYGRMSLSNYVLQPLIGVPFFYAYGASMYLYFDSISCLLYGLVFVTLQICFSVYWMKNYYYGPMEWVWRSLTFGSAQKMKKD